MTAPTEPGLDRVHRHLEASGAGALSRFKAAYFERRLRSRWRAHRVADADAYADVLDRDPDERRRLVSALAIGVTSFFRDPPVWTRLGALVGAEATDRAFRAWSAGCASGEEAWSVAMLLDSLALAGGTWSVLGTDLDARSLTIAAAGEYQERSAAAVRVVLDPVPGEFAAGRYRVPTALRARVSFARADLVAPPSSSEFDLVLCRNVLMYFTPHTQEQILTGLLSATRIGGLLVLGKAELAALPLLPRLEIVDRRERIYRRVA